MFERVFDERARLGEGKGVSRECFGPSQNSACALVSACFGKVIGRECFGPVGEGEYFGLGGGGVEGAWAIG